MRAIVVPAVLALAAGLASCRPGEQASDAERWGGDTIAAATERPVRTANGERVWRSHDEVERCTSVIGLVFGERPGDGDRSVDMHLRVDEEDSASGAIDSVRVMVHAAHSGQDGTPEEAPPLVLTLDGGAPMRVEGRTGRSLLSKRPEGGVVDRVDYLLSAADVGRIAAARTAEGDAGVVRFTLAEDERAVFGAFAAMLRSRPARDALGGGPLVGPDCLSIQGGR